MNREYLDFIEDILDAMNKAEELLQGVSYSQFETDFRINNIWDVVKRDIPNIKPEIEGVLEDYV